MSQKYDKNIRAKIVKSWDRPLVIPEEMGVPLVAQMQGTEPERLCELAGRICYDSLGAGRDSDKYHEHIAQVGHFSTIEHAWFTVNLVPHVKCYSTTLMALLNRPQILVCPNPDTTDIRVTLNLRHAVEWDKQSSLSDVCQHPGIAKVAKDLGSQICNLLSAQAPRIVSAPSIETVPLFTFKPSLVVPKTDSEKFVTCYLSGGRGFSHEQVRHRFAISQRSSRFCDESESDIVEHPLLTEFLADTTVSPTVRAALAHGRKDLHEKQSGLYRSGVDTLQSWLKARGVENTTARKQARGTMRNDLGNGLFTEMLFSCNLNQWRHIFTMRSSPFADAEIREVYCRLLPEFQKHDLFTSFEMTPAPDGLGHCVVMK